MITATHFPPKRILFPVDFSDRSVDAARMVEAVTGHFQSHLTLLHVVEPLTYNDLPVDPTRRGDDRLKRFLIEELKHFDVRRTLAHGDPADCIVQQSESSPTDLLMLPTHGYGRFRRFIIGSVAAKVLHDAKCPVWTSVHAEKIPTLEEIRFKRVLCAVDLGKQTCSALRYAAAWAQEFGSELTVVHAIPTAREITEIPLEPAFRYELIANAETTIGNLLEELDVQADIRIEADDAPRGVHTCAEAVKADLLVIGRSLEEGVLGRLRTNAYSIIRQSPCPVISV